jgi:hypothetical protein
LTSALAMASFLAASVSAEAGAQPSYEQLLTKLNRMEARIRSLESELHHKTERDANQGSKVRQGRTNHSKAARGQQEAAHAAEPAAGQQTAALKSPAPGDYPSAAKPDLAPAPGFLGAAETTALEAPAQPGTDLFGVAPSPVPGLRIGAYGEVKYGGQQNPAANGQWQTGFDAARFVLTPSYQFNDNIVLNAEVEFEHAGTGFDPDDKLHGTAEIEQL